MNPWFDQVYDDPLYLRLYEKADDRVARCEAEGAQALLAPPAGGLWLDVCCGFGRHAEQFARSGFRVVGVDRSPEMLRRAVARRRRHALQLAYVRGDLRSLPFVEQFDCATVMFDSFGFFAAEAEHADALLSLSAALKPHGRLLIQLANRERTVADFSARERERRGAFTITKERTLDLPHGRLRLEMRIRGPGQDRIWHLELRLFAASELRALLEQAGFGAIRFYGDWTGGAYGPGSPLLIATARKAILADLPALPD